MKVLVLTPPHGRTHFLTRFTMTEPLTGCFLGPALGPAHETRIVDLRLQRDLGRALSGWVPDVAVVTVTQLAHTALPATLGELSSLAPECRVLVTGAADYGAEHVVERPMDFAHPLVDAILPTYSLQVATQTIPALVDVWARGGDPIEVPGLWIQKAPHEWIHSGELAHTFGACGLPDRTLLGDLRGRYRWGGHRDVAYVVHTFGCKHSCRYCTMSKTSGPIIERPVGDVLAELETVTEKNVFLADFEPLQAPDAMLRLADSIQASGLRKRFILMTRADSALDQAHVLERWKEVGLTTVFLGLDAHSNGRMREVRKGSSVSEHEAAFQLLRDLELTSVAGMTVSPDAGRDDFADMRATLRRVRPDMFGFTVETPLVGTRWFDEVESQLTTKDWSLFDLEHAVLPTRLELSEFYRELTKLQLMAFSWPRPGIAFQYGLRGMAANLANALGGVLDVARSTRDHASAPGSAAPAAA
jgi:hypothetical protein